jgi:TPR repeat protein
MYEQGIYVEKNESLAIEYYTKALENGNPQSGNNLGLFYLNGREVERDLHLAEDMFLYCFKKGCNDSIPNLVRLYEAKSDPQQLLLCHTKHLQLNNSVASAQNDSVMRTVNKLRKKLKAFNIPGNKSLFEFYNGGKNRNRKFKMSLYSAEFIKKYREKAINFSK